jgi:hypothetical protein
MDGAPIDSFMETLGIPVRIPARQVFLSLREAEGGYEALIWVETPSVSEAKGLAAALSLARLFMPRKNLAEGPGVLIAALFAYPPSQDGTHLSLRTPPLTAGDIALLFQFLAAVQ